MSLLEKVGVLDMWYRGVSVAVVGCCCGVKVLTVSCIKQNDDTNWWSIKASGPSGVNILCVSRDLSFDKLERALCVSL